MDKRYFGMIWRSLLPLTANGVAPIRVSHKGRKGRQVINLTHLCLPSYPSCDGNEAALGWRFTFHFSWFLILAHAKENRLA